MNIRAQKDRENSSVLPLPVRSIQGLKEEDDLFFFSLLNQMWIFSQNTFTDTPRNNLLPAIWAYLRPMKLTHNINHRKPYFCLFAIFTLSSTHPELLMLPNKYLVLLLPYWSLNVFSFAFFPYILPSLGSILTNLPFLGYLCQKHNVTMEITRTLMLDAPGVKPHPGPPSSCVPLEKLVKFSEMLFPCVSEHRGV